jgi:hypothetical protein
MRVVATQQGFYDQILREVGEVFELLKNKDGSDPQAFRRDQVLDEKGVPIPRKFVKVALFEDEAKKKPLHRDYAEDMGNVLIEQGPLEGETFHNGWMKKVPDRVPCGLYPLDQNGALLDFWSPHVQLPPAWPRVVGQQDRRAAKIQNAA